MITKQQFTDSVLAEMKIIKHLFTKIAPGTFDYKPTTTQRTTLELLRYLSIMGTAATKAVHANDRNIFMEERKKNSIARARSIYRRHGNPGEGV